MQWKSRWICFLFFVAFTVATAGCRPSSSALDVPTAPYANVELRIACPNEATAALLRGYGIPWALRQGVKLTLLRHDAAEKPDSPADVWIIAPANLPRWAAAGQLVAVPERFAARNNSYAWSDLLPIYRDQLTQWDGTAYALPLMGESPLCCCRDDLLKEPAHRDAIVKLLGRDAGVPATWEQFAQLAEYFHEHGPEGRPAPSLPPLPRGEADLDRLFYTVAAGFARRAVPADEARDANRQDDVFSFHYDSKSGRSRIAAPGFVHALKLLQRLQACRPTEPVDRPEEAFRDGRAVLCLADAPWLKTFQRTPTLRDKIGVGRVPGGDRYFDFETGQARPMPEGNRLPYLGGAGWLAVVPRSSQHVEAAFDLLAELSGPKTSKQIFLSAIKSGGPLRGEQLYRHRWDSFDLDETRTPQLQKTLQDTLLHRGLKNPVLCLRTPHQASHRAALDKEIRAALLQGRDAEKALGAVAETWEKLNREQGMEAHRADYRRSLGLLAK